MNIEIKRDYYLEQLISRMDNGLIKVVTGIRRCGKSYLLRTLLRNICLNKVFQRITSLKWHSTYMITLNLETQKCFILG